MTQTIIQIGKIAAVGFVLLALPLVLFAYDAGNDAVPRTHTDTWTDFTIVDTNNPFANDGNVSEFEYYAANTNAFRILVVDDADTVQYVSEEITPIVGVGTYLPAPFVPVEAGWNLAVYSVSSGVIPHDKGGSAAEYENLNAGLPVEGEVLSYVGQSDRTYSLNATLFQPVGEIVEPTVDEIVYGVTDLVATYNDGDEENDDIVNWAVREGTCAVNDAANVAGNVGAFASPNNTPYDWDGADFTAELDTTGFTPGMYCFIFNPTDDAGQNDVRETREFYVAGAHVSGGGQIIEEIGEKKKDWLKVSFGGWVADIGELVGSWEVNFHNVGDDSFDKTKFHGEDIVSLNMFDSDSGTCTGAVNMTVNGSYEGEEGWSMIIRAGDDEDTMRFSLYDTDSNLAYDTHDAGEFSDESTCVGTARTGLDAGDITIVQN